MKRIQDPIKPDELSRRQVVRWHNALRYIGESIKSLTGLPPSPARAVAIDELKRIRRYIYKGVPSLKRDAGE